MDFSLQDVDLVHDLAFLALFLHKVHVDALDRAEFPSETMEAEIDLSKCSFTKHFPDLVQL